MMSRTMLLLCVLTFTSGCCTWFTPRGASIGLARVETLCPYTVQSSGNCDNCGDCIPHRPYGDTYKAKCDNFVTQHTAHKCAFHSLGEYQTKCGRPISHDFKAGFIAAYEDLAMNRRPVPPIVPPEKYWNAFYRSCAGKPHVDDWFAGYDTGLEMGMNSGVSRFHEVYLRRGGCDNGPVSQASYSTGPGPVINGPGMNPYGSYLR